jgi:arginase
MGTRPLAGLEVVAVRYWGSGRERQAVCALDAYEAEGAYAAAGVPFTVTEPGLPADAEYASDTEVLGALGGEIAGVVAAASREGRGVLVVGGNCTHMPGVIGGLEDAHGADVRIGLVWFDAHGDFNTPTTSLTGFLGGMPVAVCAGLAHPEWREGSHIAAPLPTDRIVMVDVRNLDRDEERLIRATDVIIAGASPKRTGEDLGMAVSELADRTDLIYLHIDADILDETMVPAHRTREPRGPGMKELSVAVDAVMATGKVAAYAVVSVCGSPEENEVDMASGTALVRAGLESWARHGMPDSLGGGSR